MKILQRNELVALSFSAKNFKKPFKKQESLGAKTDCDKKTFPMAQKDIVFANRNINSAPDFTIYKLNQEDLKVEKEFSNFARTIGIDTPKINSDGSYKIYGKQADYKTNPIRNGHLKNVMKNLLILDMADLLHGDVEQGHVFYDKGCDEVELDCFRFAYSAKENEGRVTWEYPCDIYPSNLVDYENNCLGNYLLQMDDEEEKNSFLKQYLKTSSSFFERRFEVLSKKENVSKDQLEYEKLKAKLYKNPSDDLAILLKDRINARFEDRKAFTDWDEGFGACGHKKDEKRTTDAILEYFDVIDSHIKLVEKIKDVQQKSDDKEIKALLDFEFSYANHWLNNRINSTKDMANWTLNPENNDNITHRCVDEDLKEEFNSLFEEFKTLNNAERLDLISELKDRYSQMLKN